ncbi:hypothetical protein L0938_02180 [Paracidovorax citrulli]
MRLQTVLLLSLFCPLAGAQTPAAAEAAEAPATTAPDLQATGTARVRVFSTNGASVSVITRRQCGKRPEPGESHDIRVAPGLLKAPDNLRIGMPDTSYSRQVSGSTGMFSRTKPYFHEITVPAGLPASVYASYLTSTAYCKRGLSMAFIPVAGMDYEFAMTTTSGRCALEARRIGADGVTYPLATSPREESCGDTAAFPGSDLMVFLFEPGAVQYKVEGSLLAPPETVADEEAFAQAFERRVASVADRKVRACLVMPEAGYRSPLLSRLMAVIGPEGRNLQTTVTATEDVPRMPGNPGSLGYREAALHCTLPGMALPPVAAP